ncbi:MAG TPA: ATP-binding protein, partial [Thermoanaerobaculia bacterium]|nr:ATP-binding protein [Thermoanaerobaculia bacterium]
ADLARADVGRLGLVLGAVSAGDAVRNAIASHGPRAEARGVRLLADVAALPPLRADPRRLAQMLRNLIENAVAHSPAGASVVVEARPSSPGFAEVAVRDAGEGIAPEHRSRVFERFYRADPARSRETGGSGLGLPIVRELARAQGGEVSLRSEVGRGTIVAFTLPFIENS